MAKPRMAFLAGLLAASSACGAPQQQQPVKSGGSSVGGASAETTAAIDTRMRVGHYRSHDGSMAFRLDRSDQKVAKIQYDGSSEVVELTPRHGSFGRMDYVKKGHSVWLSVYPDGRVTAYHKDRPDGMAMIRDDQQPAKPCCQGKTPMKKDQPVEVKLRLGHFSSADGALAFVLDRRDDKVAKLRYDGSSEVIELTPRHGSFGRMDYAKQGHGVWLSVYPDGRVTAYHKDRPAGIPMSRDGDADPL